MPNYGGENGSRVGATLRTGSGVRFPDTHKIIKYVEDTKLWTTPLSCGLLGQIGRPSSQLGTKMGGTVARKKEMSKKKRMSERLLSQGVEFLDAHILLKPECFAC